MSRHTGPRIKIMRALGVDLPGLSRKSMEKRPTPPGQHGARAARKRKSDFGVKLTEKQKLRFNYGLSERQLQRLVLDARKSRDPTGDMLLQLLERRLDNIVFRSGFAPTVPAARQLVQHGHVRLNGRRVNIPSARLHAGDEISIKAASRNMPLVAGTLSDMPLTRPEWLTAAESAEQGLAVRVTHLPSAQDVPFPIDVQQVVEYYAHRI